jgi:hypothetical protein
MRSCLLLLLLVKIHLISTYLSWVVVADVVLWISFDRFDSSWLLAGRFAYVWIDWDTRQLFLVVKYTRQGFWNPHICSTYSSCLEDWNTKRFFFFCYIAISLRVLVLCLCSWIDLWFSYNEETEVLPLFPTKTERKHYHVLDTQRILFFGSRWPDLTQADCFFFRSSW